MSLEQYVKQSALRRPQAIAIVGPDTTMTYQQLDRDADAVALQLRAAGVQPGDRVLIWMPKSARAVTFMQGVLRIGAVYVPADDAAPAGRVATISKDCAAAAVCAPDDWLRELADVLGPEIVRIDTNLPLGAAQSIAPVHNEPDGLAYILYTSGSTGRPKGVCLTHRNAIAFIDWAASELAAEPSDRFANHAALTFDISVLDLYVPFAVGASVHLLPSAHAFEPWRMVDFIHDQGITVWYSVPSALLLMASSGGLFERAAPKALRAVLFAGEPFPIAPLRQLADWTHARLLNLYGPTETNVCTFHEVQPSDLLRDRPPPIGRACSGDDAWAITSDGSVAQCAELGELVVSGPTVTRGYWGAPALTPPYHTGDVVRVLPDGSFDYVGRVDHMVKIRGHRVDPGEVEAVLAAHAEVAEVAVIAVGDGLALSLHAFITPIGADRGTLTLRRHCASLLPRYMIPTSFHFCNKLPRNRNGKIDRKLVVADLNH